MNTLTNYILLVSYSNISYDTGCRAKTTSKWTSPITKTAVLLRFFLSTRGFMGGWYLFFKKKQEPQKNIFWEAESSQAMGFRRFPCSALLVSSATFWPFPLLCLHIGLAAVNISFSGTFCCRYLPFCIYPFFSSWKFTYCFWISRRKICNGFLEFMITVSFIFSQLIRMAPKFLVLVSLFIQFLQELLKYKFIIGYREFLHRILYYFGRLLKLLFGPWWLCRQQY